MTLRTGLIITGDSNGAQKALIDLVTVMDKATGAAKGLGAAETIAETATTNFGSELRKTGAATDTVAAELERAGLSATGLAVDMNKAAGAAKDLSQAETVAEVATESLAAELRKTGVATDTVAAELERAGLSATGLAVDMGKTGIAAKQMADAETIAEAATEGLEAELRQARGALASTVNELNQMRESAAALAGRVDVLETQLNRASVAGRVHGKSLGEQALGARMLGQQVQDMGLMWTMSGMTADAAMRAISAQAGQTALAVEQMGVKGAIGRFATFMGTPWGSILLTAGLVLASVVPKMNLLGESADTTRDKLEDAAEAADSFGDAQSLLGKVVDLTIGKLKTQNSVLVQSIRLQSQLNLLEAQKAIDKATGADKVAVTAAAPGSAGMMGVAGGDVDAAARGRAAIAGQQRELDRLKAALVGAIGNDALAKQDASQYANAVDGQLDRTISRLDKLAVGGKFAGKSLIDVKTELVSLATLATNKSAALQSLAVLGGGKPGADLTPYEREKKNRAKKPASVAARDEFGRDTGDRIASITEAFSQTPAAVQQADKAVRQLDDIIDDLGRKKPPNFEALIVSAKAAKQTVETGLLRSLSDAYKAPETLAQKAVPLLDAIDNRIRELADNKPLGFEKLIAEAKVARSEIETGIIRPYTELVDSQEQSLAILNLQAKARFDEADALRIVFSLEKQIGPLRDDQKDAILASVQALRAQQREVEILRQDTQKYVDALSSIEGVVRDASQAFVRGDLGQFIKTPGKLLDAFATLKGQKLFDDLFSGVFRDLQDEVNGTSIVKDASTRMAASVDQVTASTGRTTQALDSLARSAANAAGAVGSGGGVGGTVQIGTKIGDAIAANLQASEIVVTGKRQAQLSPEGLISKAVGGVATSITSLFSSPETAKNIGGAIGKVAGKGLEGAATGSMVAGISNALGIKMSGTGAQIGGAIGSFIPIPGGDIIGSILGGLAGNLFKSAPRGSAQITSVDQKAIVNGNSDEIKSDLGGLAGSVQSAISKIASTLGGDLGSFAVSINKYKDSYRVDPSGGTSVGGKYGDRDGVLKFDNNDAEGAVRAAIANAISDGAIKGLSGAVQQALGSSTDIDRALQEAVKVSNVEQLLGGFSGELTKAFKSYEKEAADRLRIARQYGFDIVKVEAANAKERAALADKLADQQVGSLKRLVEEMTSGSLFEGSAVDRRSSLLDSITKAQADMQAGVDGAGDKLANLYDQLNAVSKDVYGTTGGFAVDRAAIVDQARAAIAKTNADISAAQSKASDPALSTTNASLDENNDQNARMIAQNEQILTALKQVNVQLGKSASDSDVARLIQLAKTS